MRDRCVMETKPTAYQLEHRRDELVVLSFLGAEGECEEETLVGAIRRSRPEADRLLEDMSFGGFIDAIYVFERGGRVYRITAKGAEHRVHLERQAAQPAS